MLHSCYNSKSVDCNETYLIFYFRTSKKKRKNTKTKYITTDIYLIIAATNYNYNEIVIYFQYLKGLNLIKSLLCFPYTHNQRKTLQKSIRIYCQIYILTKEKKKQSNQSKKNV